MDTERAVDKIERLTTALDRAIDAGADENRRNLEGLLEASVTGELTTLLEVANRVDPAVKFIFDQSFETSLRGFESLLAESGLEPPLVKLAGLVADIDPTDETVLVSPREGSRVRLQLTPATSIQIFGAPGRPDSLEAGQHKGQRLESLYDPRTNEATTLSLLRPTLDRNLVGGLLDQAQEGELEGVVLEANAVAVGPTLVVRLPAEETVTLERNGGHCCAYRGRVGEAGRPGAGSAGEGEVRPGNIERVERRYRRPGDR